MRLIDKTLDKRRIPLGGGIELTERCNMNCVHCFINRPANDHSAKTKEMSTKEFCHLVDDLADRECLWLQITGGEPLLRSDFIEIYLHAKRRGMLVSVFTNATLITERIADVLEEYPPRVVEVSIYGATKDTHERVTRVQGSYEQCMEGINRLRKRHIPLLLKTMAMTINRHEIFEMKDMARRLNVEFRYDPLIQSRYDGGKDPRKVWLTPEEIIEMDLADEERAESLRYVCENFLKKYPGDQWLACDAGRYGFFIDPYGHLMPCISLRKTSYDLRKGNFDEGFHKFFGEVLKRRQVKHTICTDCNLRALCYQCPAWSQTEHGDDESPVEYLCEVTKLREKVFLKKGG